jgi:hypothetical protein
MKIRIAATAAESTSSFIEIGSEVPFSIIAAVMQAVAESAAGAYVTVESGVSEPFASPRLDPAMYGESAKLALDAITVPPIVRPVEQPATAVQHVAYVEMPKELQPAPTFETPADAKYLTAVPVDPTMTVTGDPAKDFPPEARLIPTAAQLAAQAALATVKPEVLAKESLEVKKFESISDLAKTLPSDNPLAQAMAAPAEALKKRTRKAAAEVQADSAVPVQANPAPVSPSAVIPESQPSATLPAQPVAPPQRVSVLSKEESNLIRPRLAKYRNTILTGKRAEGFGGMETVLGGPNPEEQMRAFFQAFRSDKPNTKEWTYVDWLKAIDFMDDVVKVQGAYGLVRLIQQRVGLVPDPDDGSPAAVRK